MMAIWSMKKPRIRYTAPISTMTTSGCREDSPMALTSFGVTRVSVRKCPSTCADMMMAKIMPVVFTVSSTVSPNFLVSQRPFAITRISAASTPRAAASVGVAMPVKMDPTTARKISSSGEAFSSCSPFSERGTGSPCGARERSFRKPMYITSTRPIATTRPGKKPATNTSPTGASAVIA